MPAAANAHFPPFVSALLLMLREQRRSQKSWEPQLILWPGQTPFRRAAHLPPNREAQKPTHLFDDSYRLPRCSRNCLCA
jgi:hypothetical protein